MPSRICSTLLPILTLVTLLLVTACQPVAPGPGSPASVGDTSAPATLTVAAHDSFNLSEEIIAAFEEEHNATVQVLALGDAGEALNKIILSKDAPLADLFFGVDNTFLSRALDADVFVPYASPALENIPDELELDPEHRLLPVDVGYININADRAWFEENNLPIPATLEELTQPEYAGLLVVMNPATSSPGLAFLLTTIAYFGEDGYLAYWESLAANDVLIVDGWSTAYYEHFTAGSEGAGDRPLVVSYSSSPPADVVFATDGRTEPATVNVSPANGTFRQIEFVGILQGASQPELAQAWIDYMLSVPVQEDIPLQMYVYPANATAELPDLFVQFAQRPEAPAALDPATIEANREAWIAAWTDLMLR
jgi:thiamine transport system substrate-binding protein